jgi:hypothetical protein
VANRTGDHFFSGARHALPPLIAVPATVLATVILLAGCAAVGMAVCRVGGIRGMHGSAPAVGLALLMTVASPAARLVAGGGLPLAAVGVVIAAAVVVARPRVLLAALGDWAPVALVVVAVVTLPWVAAGHDGLLGMGMNNDTPVHLIAARWLVDRGMPAPETLVAAGYPLGPHALSVALSVTGLSLASAFTAVSMLAPPLAALAALDGLRELRPLARRGLAILAGLSYMFVSYYAQMAFKETIEAALLLSFALLLPAVTAAARTGPRAAARAVVPLAVLLSGMVQTMSWPGLLWPLGTLGVWLVLEALLGRRSPLELLSRARPALWSGGVAVALLLSFEVPRIVAFQGSRYAHEPDHGLGNLEGHLRPWKVLGVWLDPDFRFGTRLPLLTAALIVATGVFALIGVRTWLRRGERALPAAVLAGCVVYAGLGLTKNGYNAAKGLPVLAPFITLAVVTGAVVVWRRAAGRQEPVAGPQATVVRFAAAGLPPAPGRASAVRALVVGVLGAGLLCSLWVLREAVVGVDAHARELRTLAAAAPPGPMLVLDNSDWVAWNLYGAEVWRPPLLYAIHTAPLRGVKDWHGGDPYDLDSVTAGTLNQFTSVLTARSPAGSTPPPGLRVLRQTHSFTLWERTGTVPAHRTLAEGPLSGAVLDCSTPVGAHIAQEHGTALVIPPPVVGSANSWTGTARDPGTTASQTLRLPPGRWDLSLQYVSRRPLTVRAGTLRTTVAANLDRMGPLFGIGTTDGGTIRVTVRQQDLTGLARALGTRGRTRALNSPRSQPLGMIVATRHGGPGRRVPLARACGQYVDWYTVARR